MTQKYKGSGQPLSDLVVIEDYYEPIFEDPGQIIVRRNAFSIQRIPYDLVVGYRKTSHTSAEWYSIPLITSHDEADIRAQNTRRVFVDTDDFPELYEVHGGTVTKIDYLVTGGIMIEDDVDNGVTFVQQLQEYMREYKQL